MRILFRGLSGVLSVVVLAALVIGIPIALILAIGNPLNSDTITEVGDLVAGRNLSPTGLLGPFLAIVIWFLWAQITWTTSIELLATIRGGINRQRTKTQTRSLIPGIQPAIGKLVATAALLLGLLTRPAAATAMPLSAIVTTEVSETQPTAAPETQPEASTGHHVAEAGDTWWDLAEQHYGDGKRWKDIRSLNIGARVSPTETITNDTDRINIGWTLKVPAAQQTASTVHPVADGDTVWGIAKQTLPTTATNGEIGDRVDDIVEANPETLQNPDNIQPGDNLRIPAATDLSTEPEVNETHQTLTPPAISTSVSSDQPAIPNLTSTPAPSVAPMVTTTLAPVDTVDEQSTQSEQGSLLAAAAVILIGGTLTLAFRNRRKAALRKRPQGKRPRPIETPMRTVTQPNPVTVVTPRWELGPSPEQTNRVWSKPTKLDPEEVETTRNETAAEFVATALQAMSEVLATQDSDVMPDVLGIWIAPHRIAIEFTTDSPWVEPTPPFANYGNGQGWTLDRNDLPQAADLAARGANGPLPGLLTLGSTSTFELGIHQASKLPSETFGTEFITFALNIEQFGTIQLNGDLTETEALLQTIATELALSRTADMIDVACVGFGQNLTGIERIRHFATTADVLPLAETIADHTTIKPFAARVANEGADSFYPFVVLHTAEVEDADSRKLATHAETPTSGVTLITTTETTKSTLTLELINNKIASPDIASGARLTVPQIDTNLVGDLFNAETHECVDIDFDDFWNRDQENERPLIEVLAEIPESDLNPEPDQAAPASVPAMPRLDTRTKPSIQPVQEPVEIDVRSAADIEEQLNVSFLGPLLINGISTTGPNRGWKYNKVPELIAYLLLEGNYKDTHQEKIMTALYPDAAPNRRRMNLIVSQARTKALGTDPEGNDYLPKTHNNRDPHYRLLTTVTSDLALFDTKCKQAIGQSNPDKAIAKWEEALQLVRGRPFDVGTYDGWEWASATVEHVVIKVEEAAMALTDLALKHNKPQKAVWAAEKGLLTETENYDILTNYGKAALILEDPTVILRASQAIQVAANYDPDTPESQEAIIPPQLADIFRSLRVRKVS